MRKSMLRVNILFTVVLLMACLIVYRIFIIQVKEGEYWRSKVLKNTIRLFEIQAIRGNIFDQKGYLLATSVPYYEVGFDINAPSLKEEDLKKSLDSLCQKLAELFKNKPAWKYKKEFNEARKNGDRYVLIQRNVSYKELKTLRTFPILRNGKKGGLVILQYGKRERPFRLLAARTIGYSRPGIKPVGIEGAYDSILRGINGKRLMQKIAVDVWRPLNDKNEVEPKDGCDIITTLDINIQDVAEKELMNALEKNQASHGCAILMEVKTGAIKAIANLTRIQNKDTVFYEEVMNYAVGYPTEPGSTFKLASMLALMEEHQVGPDETVFVGNGQCTYYDRLMKDAHPPHASTLTLKDVFAHSSNVGTSRLITKYFQQQPEKFVKYMKKFHLHEKIGIDIPGEGQPKIKHPKNKDWYGTTLPWMSIGYEVMITPIQLLTLYNAIANNGCMVKPRFISEILVNGKTIKKYSPQVIDSHIVSPSTVEKAKILMEYVVENGTGRAVKIPYIKVGGKTGTAQIAKKGNYKSEGSVTYQASFVGYFPADNPLYTCLVIINSPSNGIYYGGLVAAPVFKEIATKVWSTDIEFHKPINLESNRQLIAHIPPSSAQRKEIIYNVYKQLHIPLKDSNSNTENYTPYAILTSYANQTQLKSVNHPSNLLNKSIMPDLTGFTPDEAVFILENAGLDVKIKGAGWVVRHFPEPGKKIEKNQTVQLVLGI
ncbi:MAG: transpeptidase family protein [Bacteroidia bacterium]|nr:transpeptidase family protein [Bacteroidia bacterium]